MRTPPKALLAGVADPETVLMRFSTIRQDATARKIIARFSDWQLQLLLRILDLSDFLFHFLCRHPHALASLDEAPPLDQSLGKAQSLAAMRHWKYRCLLQISALDLGMQYAPSGIFALLSTLADAIARQAHELALRYITARTGMDYQDRLASLAFGKLGAGEINYSSDIDLIFVCDAGDISLQQTCEAHIRHFSCLLEQRTEEGFLYRVDLNLRPWGQRAPLILSIDAIEQYYEGSKEAWERFVWLRARPLTGSEPLALDLIERLQPFVYQRSLGFEDIQRFVKIKSAMAKQRQRRGEWNIKTGQGGIRDIEFFVQFLQILNGARCPALRVVGTLDAMDAAWRCGLIDADRHHALRAAYLFLRRLENRVQMVDEQQTHVLPSTPQQYLRIACAMAYDEPSPEARLERFQLQLAQHRQVSQRCFEDMLEATG